MARSVPRILHIITGLDTGGAERSLYNLLHAGLQDSFDNHVVSLSGLGHYGPMLKEQGIAVHAIGLREGTGIAKGFLALRKLIAHIGPAAVQGWMYHGNLAATAAVRAVRAAPPVAWNIRHSLDALDREKRGTRWMIRTLAPLSRSPQAIIYNSYRSRDQHEAYGYSAMHALTIPNGFDTAKWRPDPARRKEWRAKLGFDTNELVLGFVGRFHPLKDIPTFLRACNLALDAHPDLSVVMVGEGLDETNRAIVEAIDSQHLSRFRLVGRRPDIEAILPACDLFCLSSTSEAFPNVLGEAMASGLPCVATDVGDCARLMDGTGRIVRTGDAKQLADAIGDLACMDLAARTSIGEAARNRIVSTYSVDAMVEAYADLYDKIMKRDD